MMKNKPYSKEQKRRNKRLEDKQTILRAFDTPTIRIESKLANNSFVAVVNSVIDKIDLFDEKYFPPYVQDFFAILSNAAFKLLLSVQFLS